MKFLINNLKNSYNKRYKKMWYKIKNKKIISGKNYIITIDK